MEDFEKKYTKTNFITRKLIGGFYRTVESLLRQIDFSTVLEIGCGPGFSSQYLINIFNQLSPNELKLSWDHIDPDQKTIYYEASEYEEELVDTARKNNPGLKISRESIYQLDRKDHSLDLVIVLEVLEHLEDPEAALKELIRVSNRYVLLSVPREPVWSMMNLMRGKYIKSLGNTPGHIQRWGKRRFFKFVSRYFTVIDIKSPLPWTVLLAEKK